MNDARLPADTEPARIGRPSARADEAPRIPSPAAAATSVEAALRGFGLPGHWARQCDAPASPDNNHVAFERAATGEMQEVFTFGPGIEPNVYTIISAVGVDNEPDQVRLGLVLRGVQNDVILRVHDDTIRTLSSIRGDGTVLVKDGVITANDDETHVLPRCSDAES